MWSQITLVALSPESKLTRLCRVEPRIVPALASRVWTNSK